MLAVPCLPRDLRVIQTFTKLTKNNQLKEYRHDVFNFEKNARIHGIAVFAAQFTLIQEQAFSLKITLKNLATGISAHGVLMFDKNSDAGIKKIWLNQILDAKTGEFIKAKIELIGDVDAQERLDLLAYVRNVEEKHQEPRCYQNKTPDTVVFTCEVPRFICGLYFSDQN